MHTPHEHDTNNAYGEFTSSHDSYSPEHALSLYSAFFSSASGLASSSAGLLREMSVLRMTLSRSRTHASSLASSLASSSSTSVEVTSSAGLSPLSFSLASWASSNAFLKRPASVRLSVYRSTAAFDTLGVFEPLIACTHSPSWRSGWRGSQPRRCPQQSRR